MITKQNPFKRDNEAATLKAVNDDAPHPVARYRSDIPEALQGIIERVLEKPVETLTSLPLIWPATLGASLLRGVILHQQQSYITR